MTAQSPAQRRALLILIAERNEREAAIRSNSAKHCPQSEFVAWLLEGAKRARAEAATLISAPAAPVQLELFA